MAGGETLVGGEARLFERMGERVMADVMEQRGELDLQLLGHTAGKMVRTQRVLKPGVCGPRVNEKCVTELQHVPQPLERRRVDDRERLRVEADVVPERVANDLELTQVFGPASRTLAGTRSVNCSKFFRKRAVSFFAWVSYAAGSFHVARGSSSARSEEHTSELQSRPHLVCRLLLEKKKNWRTVND